MIGERVVEGVAEVPAVGQVEACRLDQLALGADALEEHDQLQLEEDDRVDARLAPVGVQLPRLVAHERQVESGFQVAIEGIGRDQLLQQDGGAWPGRARCIPSRCSTAFIAAPN